jgi:hypothetical protein
MTNTEVPAFPWCGDLNACPTINLGLTKREYFAAHSGVTWTDAVNFATEGNTIKRTGPEIAAALAAMRYCVADAMLNKV